MNEKQKAAHAKASREWRARNPEKVRFWNRRDYEKNKEARDKYRKRWAAANKDKTRAYSRKSAAKWRKRHPERAAASLKRRNAKQTPILAAFILHKKEGGCTRCSEKFPACLDFHHIERHPKNRRISLMARQNWNIATVEAEMAKCVLLCSNCHRKQHATDGTYTKKTQVR